MHTLQDPEALKTLMGARVVRARLLREMKPFLPGVQCVVVTLRLPRPIANQEEIELLMPAAMASLFAPVVEVSPDLVMVEEKIEDK